MAYEPRSGGGGKARQGTLPLRSNGHHANPQPPSVRTSLGAAPDDLVVPCSMSSQDQGSGKSASEIQSYKRCPGRSRNVAFTGSVENSSTGMLIESSRFTDALGA